MKFKKQIIEFLIKLNDDFNDNERKESNDNFLKEYFKLGLEIFSENNQEILHLKFIRKDINLNDTESMDGAICLNDIQKSFETISNIRSWLENFVSSLSEDDYKEPQLDNLFNTYASLADTYLKGKDRITSSMNNIKKYLEDLGFGFDNDNMELFIQNFPKKDFLEKFFPFKSKFLKDLYQDEGILIWKELNGDVKPDRRRSVDADADQDKIAFHEFTEEDIRKNIQILENDENYTLKKCSIFFHKIRKSLRYKPMFFLIYGYLLWVI